MEIDLVQFASGGGIVVTMGLLLKFWRERRTDRTTAVEEWREMNAERKEEASALREEVEQLRSLMVACMMEIQRLDPESPLLKTAQTVLRVPIASGDQRFDLAKGG